MMEKERVLTLAQMEAKASQEEYFGKGIKVASGFDLGTAAPLDTRTVRKTVESMNAITSKYEGLIVYVEEDQKTYQYRNGAFVEFGFNSAQFEAGIVDSLDSEETGKALSARQGKVLNEKIEGHINDEDVHITEEERQKIANTYTKDEVYTKEEADRLLDEKANASEVYTKGEVDGFLADKADQTFVEGELAKKADVTKVAEDIKNAIDAVKDEISIDEYATKVELTEGLANKAEKVHRHQVADIDGLGTAAVLNVGTNAGDVVQVGVDGKIATSILPSLAVNETFVVNSVDEAMNLDTAEVGDIIIVNPQTSGPDVVEGTFILVDLSKDTFEERFRPLQSISDSVSKAELEKALELKADKTQVALDIEAAKNEAVAEAGRLTSAVETKLEDYKNSNNGVIAGHEGRIVALETEMPNKADKTQVAIDIETAKNAAIAQAGTLVENAKNELETAIDTVKGELEASIASVDAKVETNAEAIEGIKEEIANNIATTLIEKEAEIIVPSAGATNFMLVEAPSLERPVKVFVNGVKYKVGRDFSLNGRELVWISPDFELDIDFVIEVSYYAVKTVTSR